MKDNMKHRNIKRNILILSGAFAFYLCTIPVLAKNTERTLCYTALGDSIPNGYCAEKDLEVVSYPQLIADDMQEVGKRETKLYNYARNGLTTEKLNAAVLQEKEVIESLGKSDLITVTIGANDLMNEFKKVSQEILGSDARFRTADEALSALEEGVSANPFLLVKVIAAIGGWDYESFEEQWMLAMETIGRYKAEGTPVVVTTIYDPLMKMDLPGTLNAVVESIIKKMNEIMTENADIYGYQVANLWDTEIGQHTQSDGLHPDQTGQKLIKELVEEQIDVQAVSGAVTEAEVSARAAKAEAKERAGKEAAERRRQTYIGIGILAANILAIAILTIAERKYK